MKGKLLASFRFAVVLAALSSTAVASTTWYVNGVSGSNSNACTSAITACKTIGHAISLGVSGDSIKVAPATYKERLTIGISLKILGSNAKTTILDGSGSIGPVVVIAGATPHVTLSGVTITNGFSFGNGAGIINNGVLTLLRSAVTGNRSQSPCPSGRGCVLRGGGILNATGARLTIGNSTVSDNHVSIPGCSVFYCAAAGGGIYNGGTLVLYNSTISGNTSGPGNYGSGISSGGSAKISNSTLSGNGPGGGLYGTATVENSIVADGCSGSITSIGYNLSSDDSCNFTSAGDLNNTDPLLGPLQYNGGPTQTLALPPGSPAVDAGDPNGCTDGLGHLLKTDQRAKPRPGTANTGCDMGAYERQSD